MNQDNYRVAVVKWHNSDEIAEAIYYELSQLGHDPSFFQHDATVPAHVDIVFSFAPYGKFMPIVQQLAKMPAKKRPLLVHWNTEGIPDLRLPWKLVGPLSVGRSWLDRLKQTGPKWWQLLSQKQPLSSLDTRLLRFRYVGDYYYAYRRGILTVFADSSAVYAQIYNENGLPTVFAPWGSTPNWYDDLGIDRDIDVLWMGKRGSKRRSDIIDRVRLELKPHGVHMHVADSEENPFIFGQERTYYLNRSKITLNVTRTWYDDNFSRFAMAAPNRSMIISEKMLPHCPDYEAGLHYVAVAPQRLAQTILHYLQHPQERATFVENAFQLSLHKLTFRNSINTIMSAVTNMEERRAKISVPVNKE